MSYSEDGIQVISLLSIRGGKKKTSTYVEVEYFY